MRAIVSASPIQPYRYQPVTMLLGIWPWMWISPVLVMRYLPAPKALRRAARMADLVISKILLMYLSLPGGAGWEVISHGKNDADFSQRRQQ